MILKKIKKAVTLIELMVGITIIGIIVIGVSNINFNRMNTKQKLEIFVNNVKANYENVRNNSLAGKGIGNNLNVPEKWAIEYSKNNNGKVITKSFNGTWNTYSSINFPQYYQILKIRCLDLNRNENYVVTTGTGIVEFDGINIKLNGDCNQASSKILELTFKFQAEEKKLEINTLNGLIETK